jgi:hypothetical protein
MRIVESVSEDEMIAVFLKAEINSPRFGDSILNHLSHHTLDRHLIDDPDTSNEHDNQRRRDILDAYRSYTQKGDLFENFPQTMTWWRVALSRDDLTRVRYIKYSYWIELSSGTRRPVDAAPNIRNGMTVFKVSSQPFLDAVSTIRQEPHVP